MNAAVSTVKIPRLTVSDILVQFQRLVLRQYAHRVDSRIDAVAERKIDNAIFRAEGNRRFCNIVGESIQTATLSAR